jgi:hypothetical protein
LKSDGETLSDVAGRDGTYSHRALATLHRPPLLLTAMRG